MHDTTGFRCGSWFVLGAAKHNIKHVHVRNRGYGVQGIGYGIMSWRPESRLAAAAGITRELMWELTYVR